MVISLKQPPNNVPKRTSLLIVHCIIRPPLYSSQYAIQRFHCTCTCLFSFTKMCCSCCHSRYKVNDSELFIHFLSYVQYVFKTRLLFTLLPTVCVWVYTLNLNPIPLKCTNLLTIFYSFSLSSWGEHERVPHRSTQREKICIYIILCMSVSLTQILLTPIATLYDNGFSGRVQNSSRAFNYPCSG